MSSEVDSVNITILGKEYQISCPPEEEEALRKSARYLDEQMARIKSRGSILGFEKIAVMAALNISHELLKKSRMVAESETGSQQDLKQLEDKIDLALQATRQMEI
ncbi:MAG: cell division protein ZapA [Pseudohongiellaceae bacterium]